MESEAYGSLRQPTNTSNFGPGGDGQVGLNTPERGPLVTNLSQLRTALEGAKKALARNESSAAELHIDLALALLRQKPGRRPRVRLVPGA